MAQLVSPKWDGRAGEAGAKWAVGLRVALWCSAFFALPLRSSAARGAPGDRDREMNKYEVLGIVGEGAYGVVLRCRNRVRDRGSLRPVTWPPREVAALPWVLAGRGRG